MSSWLAVTTPEQWYLVPPSVCLHCRSQQESLHPQSENEETFAWSCKDFLDWIIFESIPVLFATVSSSTQKIRMWLPSLTQIPPSCCSSCLSISNADSCRKRKPTFHPKLTFSQALKLNVNKLLWGSLCTERRNIPKRWKGVSQQRAEGLAVLSAQPLAIQANVI